MDLFGSPVGRHQAEQDMAKLALTDAQIQHMGVQDALAIPTAQQRSAQARWLGVRAGEKEREAAVQAFIAENVNRARGDGKPPDGNDFAALALKAGDPKLAMDLAGKQAQINQRDASATTNAARSRLIQARTRVQQMDEFARIVRGAEGPEQLQGAIQRYEQESGTRTGLIDENGVLAPGLTENWQAVRGQIQNEAVSEAQRVSDAIRQDALESAERMRKARIKNMEFWQSAENQAKIAEARRKPSVQKAGTLDRPEGARAGTDYINSQFFDIPEAQAKVMGRVLSEMASTFKQANPALTNTDALRQAFTELDKQGRFAGLDRRKPIAFGLTKRTSKAPLPLPEQADPSKLEIGAWYTNGKEKRLWLGPTQGWTTDTNKAAGLIKQAAGIVSPGNTDGEDEEDDDLSMSEEEE